MGFAALYSVVGLRADGTRASLISHASLKAAEQVLCLVGRGSGYSEFRILLEGEWPPTLEAKPAIAGRRAR